MTKVWEGFWKKSGAACAAPLQVKGRGQECPRHTSLRSLAPPRQILFLLRREPVDLNPHRLQLQLGDALVEFVGNAVDLFLQRLEILHHVLDRERLVGKAHIHHRCGMPFRRGQVNQPSLAQQIDLAPVFQRVFVDEGARRALRRGHLLERGNVDLHVEVPGVRNNRAIFHQLEMFS